MSQACRAFQKSFLHRGVFYKHFVAEVQVPEEHLAMSIYRYEPPPHTLNKRFAWTHESLNPLPNLTTSTYTYNPDWVLESHCCPYLNLPISTETPKLLTRPSQVPVVQPPPTWLPTLPRGYIFTTIMELGPQRQNNGRLGPDPTIVVYIDKLGHAR